jgi:hypothetical protein
MRLIKCPRCELNYITEEEGYCKICKQEMMGDISHDEVELCTICNERRVMPGKDICLVCYKEMTESEDASSDMNDGEEQHQVSEDSLNEIDPVSSMDEIMPEINDDIPGSEFQQINEELSLEAMGESEEEEEEDEEDDDERE